MDESKARAMLGEIFAMRLPHSWDSLDLKRFPVANYIVFRDALDSTFEGSRQKINEAKAVLRAHGIAPLFMMDEEGGRVTQISDFFATVPSPRAVSKALLPEEISVLYDHMSWFVAKLGIDLNLFPCLDVNTQLMNPIIGTRSFGRTPKSVSVYALTAFLASRPHLASAGKHFPGHGMTDTDSHLALPVVEESRQGMESIHMTPFVDAAGVGIDGIMVSHCTYVALQDDKLPASLSRQVVSGLLRDKIGFNRLVITDSLDMDAVTRNIEPKRASMLAYDAGCDILLYTKHTKRFEKSFDALVTALVSGEIGPERLSGSLARRASLIHRLRSSRKRRALTAMEAYIKVREKVLAASLSIRDPNRLLPLSPDSLTLVSTHPEVRGRLRAYVPTVAEACTTGAGKGTVLLLWLMEPLKLAYPLECMKGLVKRSGTSVLVTSYKPLADLLPDCDVSILTYDSSPQTWQTILSLLFRQGNQRGTGTYLA